MGKNLRTLVIYVIVAMPMPASDIVSKMHDLEYSMGIMQRGFFYNDTDIITKGLKGFKKTYKDFKKYDVMQYIKPSHTLEENVVLSTIKHDEENIIALEKALAKGDILRAAEFQTRIFRSCTSCHAITRSW